MGLSLASILLVYTGASVARAFSLLLELLLALAVTPQNGLSATGSFMVIGLFGLIIAMVVNIFLDQPNWNLYR